MTKLTVILKKNLYAQGILADLSKSFYTVDHKFLFIRLENYRVKGINLPNWQNLENHNQFIACENVSFSHINISCGNKTLPFFVYINDQPFLFLSKYKNHFPNGELWITKNKWVVKSK